MATTSFTSTSQVYGAATWGGSSNPVLLGKTNRVRTTASRTGGVAGLGTITGLSFVVDVATSSYSYIKGNLYVTTNSGIFGNAIAANGTYVGTYQATSASSHTITIGNFNGAAFASAIGSTTPWYIVFDPINVSANYSFVNKATVLTWTITHTPGSCSINVGGTWRKGEPWVNVGGTWRKGVIWTNVGGTWKQGK